jgi:hypothetical protein
LSLHIQDEEVIAVSNNVDDAGGEVKKLKASLLKVG